MVKAALSQQERARAVKAGDGYGYKSNALEAEAEERFAAMGLRVSAVDHSIAHVIQSAKTSTSDPGEGVAKAWLQGRLQFVVLLLTKIRKPKCNMLSNQVESNRSSNTNNTRVGE